MTKLKRWAMAPFLTNILKFPGVPMSFRGLGDYSSSGTQEPSEV